MLAKHYDAYDSGANIIQRIAMGRGRGEQDSKEHNNQITGCGARALRGEGGEWKRMEGDVAMTTTMHELSMTTGPMKMQ